MSLRRRAAALCALLLPCLFLAGMLWLKGALRDALPASADTAIPTFCRKLGPVLSHRGPSASGQCHPGRAGPL